MCNINNKIVYPDYDNSILNITASLLDLFGYEQSYKPLPELSKEYFRQFDNIVFLVVDGMGSEILKKHLAEDSLFRSNQKRTLTSVFPSTTSAAISSFLSGVSPLEHGIIGWTIYFKDYFKMIDFLPLMDSTSGNMLPCNYTEIHDIMHFDSIFKKIHKSAPEVEQHYVTSSKLTNSKYTRMASDTAIVSPYEEFGEGLEYVAQAVKANDSKKLFYCYTGEPDKSMHKLGVDDPEITKIIEDIQNKVERLKQSLQGTKSLIMVTADHGLLNTNNQIVSNDVPELWDSLILPTFPEPRFISCFVKDHKKEEFLSFFEDKKDQFLLLTREEFFEQELLGRGIPHSRLEDTLGNYFVIAIGSSSIHTRYSTNNYVHQFKAMHAGLNAQEMLVPLILIHT